MIKLSRRKQLGNVLLKNDKTTTLGAFPLPYEKVGEDHSKHRTRVHRRTRFDRYSAWLTNNRLRLLRASRKVAAGVAMASQFLLMRRQGKRHD